ncbi:MAG TPA: hypothetical protein VN228_04100 [Pyrinomonadaceae bacterium]|nr:hypothetical protein [Pyrinomonadaceae bacterium]
MRFRKLSLAFALAAAALLAAAAPAQEPAPAGFDSGLVARRLSSRNARERQSAAEELARAAAVEHRRLVEGYRVQEKDEGVRLALDWALYRMGRGPSLFPLVDALDDKKRAEQVVGYLKQIETPAPLYVFLNHVNGNTTVRLLEVLAHVGDRDTLERVRPFASSLDPNVVAAAEFAEREITIRLEETPAPEPKRGRRAGQSAETEPE